MNFKIILFFKLSIFFNPLIISMQETVRLIPKKRSISNKLKIRSQENSKNIAKQEFFSAAEKGRIKTLERLIYSWKINVDCKNEFGLTPLMLAIINNQTKTAKFLLNRDANVNLKNKYKTTALILAARYGNTEILQEILKKGANPKIKNLNNQTAIKFSAFRSKKDMTAMLVLSGAKINQIKKRKKVYKFCKNVMELFKAIDSNNSKNFCKLLKCDSILNIQNNIGNTPLHLAVINNNKFIVTSILGKNPKLISQKNYKKQTPVDLALNNLSEKKPEILIFLINLAYA